MLDARTAPRRPDPIGYYCAMRRRYEAYGGESVGWHWGLRQKDVRTHRQALERSNELLLGGLQIGPDTRILDVGFGVGGFAVWAAARFGCRVTGITICPEHVARARRRAARAAVARRCDFLRMDMEEMRFPESSFDVVVSQESFCHAARKRAFLAGVKRVLVPGGTWRCIDTFLTAPAARAAEATSLRRSLYDGFHYPSLPSRSAMARYLDALGFVDVRERDLSASVLAHWADRVDERLGSVLLALGSNLGLTTARGERRFLAGHFGAGLAFIYGLRRGLWRQVLYRARKPRRAMCRGRGAR